MEPLKVMAKLDDQGTVTPLRFWWQGMEYPVESVGRRWLKEEGEHMLVMTPTGIMFELLYVREGQKWYLTRSGSEKVRI